MWYTSKVKEESKQWKCAHFLSPKEIKSSRCEKRVGSDLWDFSKIRNLELVYHISLHGNIKQMRKEKSGRQTGNS